MNFTGLIVGFFTLVTIGLGFLWVVKLEYYVGAHVAKAVGVLGVLVVLASLVVSDFYPSALLGILGGTIFWGATELPDQEMRVKAGMFKKNPNKRPRGKDRDPK